MIRIVCESRKQAEAYAASRDWKPNRWRWMKRGTRAKSGDFVVVLSKGKR